MVSSAYRTRRMWLALALLGALVVPGLAQDDIRPSLLAVSDSVANDYIRIYVGASVVDDDSDLGIHPLMQSKIYIRNAGGEPLSVGDDGKSVTSLHMAYIGGDPIVAGIDQYATIAVRSASGNGGGTGGGGGGGSGGSGSRGATALQDTAAYAYYVFGEDDYGSAGSMGREVIDGVTHLVRTFLIDDENLLVTQYVAPYRGLARIRYTIANVGDETKQVALRFRHRPQPLSGSVGYGGMGGAQGPVFPAGFTSVEKETAYDAAVLGAGGLPTGWVSYSDDGTQAVGYSAVRDSLAVGSNPRIERIEFVRTDPGVRNLWLGAMNGERIVDGLSTMAVHYFFQAVTIEPGGTDAFQLFVGNRWASESVEAPLHASAAARPAIRLVQDPDTGEYGYAMDADGTFEVGGYITNRDTDLGALEAGQLRNGAVTVVLPEGLLMADGSTSGTQTIGRLAPGETAGVTWKVRPDPANPKYGNLNIKFQFTGDVAGGVHSRTVTRPISLPGLAHSLTPVITDPPSPDDRPGGQFAMFSVPFGVQDRDPLYGLDYTSVATGQPVRPYGIYRFDPSRGVWDTYPNGLAGELLPGRSYFVRVTERARIQVPAGSTFLNDVDEVTIPVVGRFDAPVSYGGFNMVGNPYTYPALLGDVSFLYRGRVRSYRDAWQSGWLPGVVWEWDPEANSGRGGYVMAYGEEVALNPWQGYWILTNVSMEMIIEPPAARGAQPPTGTLSARAVTGNGTEEVLAKAQGSNTLNDWVLQIRAQSGTAADSSNFMGVTSGGATRGIAGMSIPEPPPIGAYVQLAFVKSDEVGAASLYAHDVRSMSAELGYDVVVNTNIPNETITVDWPTIHQLPRELSLVLEDVQTGQRVFMRTEGAYSFTSGDEGGSRRFRVLVSTRDRGLQLVSLTTEPLARGGASIAYVLSADAEVEVVVLNAAGRVVRTIQAGDVAVAGRNLATWDGRSDQGTPVPSGRYTVRVTAHSTEGGRASQVATLSLN